MSNTDTSPRRWHTQSNIALRDSLDTVAAHQVRVAGLCHRLAAHMGYPLTDSDLLHAALHHDEAERVLGDMPSPAKARFAALADAYAAAESAILADMGLSWTLTPKEEQMLHLCDKLDAYTWARRHGAQGPEWDGARTAIVVMSDKFNAREWVLAEMGGV